MTLIAAFKINEIPFLVGDFLVTNPLDSINPSDEEIPNAHIPTIPANYLDKLFPDEWGWLKVTGVRRKICNINPNLVIAWAGSVIGSTRVVREMSTYFKNRKCNRQTLRYFFKEFEPEIDSGTPCELIGWVFDKKKKKFISFNWKSEGNALDFDIPILVGGSGRNKFTEIWEQRIHIPQKHPSNKMNETLKEAISIAGGIIGSELIVQKVSDDILLSTLHDGYGGGMEITYIEDNEIKRVDNLAFLFWRIDYKDLSIWRFPAMLFYKYLDDVLVSYTVRGSDITPNQIQLEVDEFHYITPINRENVDPLPVSHLDFHPDFYSNFFFVPLIGSRRAMFSLIAGNKEDAVQTRFEDGKLTALAFSETLFSTAREQTQAVSTLQSIARDKKRDSNH